MLRPNPTKRKLPNERGGRRRAVNSLARPVCKLRAGAAFASQLIGSGTPRPAGPWSNTARLHSALRRQALPENAPRHFPLAATPHRDSPDETTRGKLHGSNARAPALFSIAATGSNPE